MKFADLLKFSATGTSAATITFGAAVAGFRTLAQVISDGASDSLAIKVGDTGIPFTIDDGAGNKETSLFTVTSATVLTRTSVLSSTAGGATPAAFTGSALTVFNNLPASVATRLVIASVDASGNFTGLIDPKGNVIPIAGSSSATVAASGDTTGATDVAAVNNMLLLTGRVALQAAQYYVNGPFIYPSNSHLSAYGARVTLVIGVTGNIMRNKACAADKTVTDANVINAGQGANTTFTTVSDLTGVAVGDMVSMFGAGDGASFAVGSAWYGKIVTLATPANATAWGASAVKTAGQVGRPTSANGNLYQVTTAGTTGTTQPTWPTTSGTTVTDGSVTWTCLGAATGVSLNQAALNNATNATANFYFNASRNENITILGGTWICLDPLLSGHVATATYQNSFASAFRRISKLTIRDTTWMTNGGANTNLTTSAVNGNLQGLGGKFTISVADFQNITIDGTVFNVTAGDGIHLTGPGNSALITNVKSYSCGDDLVVTNLQDGNTPYIFDTEGSLSNITVRDVVTNLGKSRAFCHYSTGTRYSSTPTRWIMSNLLVDKISGDTQGPLVGIYQSVSFFTIRNISGMSNNVTGRLSNNPLVTIGADQGTWNGSIIEDITWTGNYVAQNGIVRIADPRGPINVRNLRFVTATDGLTTDPANIGLFVNGTITTSGSGPSEIAYDGFYTNGPSNGATAYGSAASIPYQFQSPPQYAIAMYFGYQPTNSSNSGTGIHLNMRNIYNTATNGFLVNKSTPALTARISIADSVLTSTSTTNTAVVSLPSGDPASTVLFNNVRSLAPLIQTQSPINVELVNTDVTCNQAAIQLVGTGVTGADIRICNAHLYGTGTLVSRDGTQPIRVRGTDIPVDQTLLTPQDGDTIYNSNATPGNGVGVALYNTAAAKWKNLYSGVTN